VNRLQRLTALQSAYLLGIQQQIPGIPTVENYCLKFARLCVEYALRRETRGFYLEVGGVDNNPCAAEVEILLHRHHPDWEVSYKKMTGGHLAFWQNLPKGWGHVFPVAMVDGVLCYVGNTTVRNIGKDFPGALRIIPVKLFPKPTSIFEYGGTK
jgi:hypothetical protein